MQIQCYLEELLGESDSVTAMASEYVNLVRGSNLKNSCIGNSSSHNKQQRNQQQSHKSNQSATGSKSIDTGTSHSTSQNNSKNDGRILRENKFGHREKQQDTTISNKKTDRDDINRDKVFNTDGVRSRQNKSPFLDTVAVANQTV